MDVIKELDKLIKESGAQLSFQPLRDYTDINKLIEYSKLLEDALCWASGKNLDVAIGEYKEHVNEFPELHK